MALYKLLEQGKDPQLFELTGGGLTNSKSLVQLKEGQKVRVSKVPVVYFEPVSEGDEEE